MAQRARADDEGDGVPGEPVRDIAEQREALRRLRASEARFREIIETVYEGVWRSDRHLITEYVNPRMAEMLGYEVDEMVGRPIDDFLDEDGRRTAHESIARQREGGQARIEFRFRRRDGTELWALVSANAVFDERGEYAGNQALVTDITAQREADDARRQAEEEFRLSFERAPIGVGLVSPAGRWLRVNAALCAMTGYTEAELLARTFVDMTHPDDAQVSLRQTARLLDGEVDGYQMEKRYLTADGDVLWVLLSVALVRDRAGAPVHFIAHVVDISERKRLEERLRFLADHDPLTGLRNRRVFAQDLLVQIGRSRRYGERAALLALDLDGFKGINDRHGHKTGDEVLEAVARAVSERVRSSDMVARLGGDEFAVLLPHIGLESARAVAGDLEAAVAAVAVRAGDSVVHPTVSIGAAGIDASTRSDEAVLADADSAMYRAKRAKASERADA